MRGYFWPDAMKKRLQWFVINDPATSFAKVAKKLNEEFPGANLTRNACIGMSRRLGLSKPDSLKGAPKKPRVVKARRKVDMSDVNRKIAARKSSPKPMPKPENPFYPLPPTKGVALMDLKLAHCRFPHGEGASLRFCGEPVEEPGKDSYCAFHQSICYRVWTKDERRERAKEAA